MSTLRLPHHRRHSGTDAEMKAEIEDFLEGFNQPTYRGMRVNGERVPVWSSKRGWSGL
jgi:hypothetical protein